MEPFQEIIAIKLALERCLGCNSVTTWTRALVLSDIVWKLYAKENMLLLWIGLSIRVQENHLKNKFNFIYVINLSMTISSLFPHFKLFGLMVTCVSVAFVVFPVKDHEGVIDENLQTSSQEHGEH